MVYVKLTSNELPAERAMNPSNLDHLNVNHGFGPIPKKRQNRAAYASTSLSLVIILVMLGVFTERRLEYEPVTSSESDVSTNTTTSSAGEVKCKPKRQYFHVGIFIWALNLIGILLGELVNRFCLISEEWFHIDTRYNGSRRKMVAACFSDMSLKSVFFATFVAFVIIGTTLISQGADYFKFEYTEIVLSGIGSSSLVLYLLSLDTLSRVQISSLLENNNRLVANGLAWSYYFGYLKLVLPGLVKRIEESPWADKISCKKLFILMPRDCFAYGRLGDEDPAIKEVEGASIEYVAERAGISRRSYRNMVYKVTGPSNETYYVLAEYATPLCSMYDMNHSHEAKLSVEDRDEQAKLFLRTLETILRNPSEPGARNRCKLVPYGRTENLKLSDVLAEAIREELGRAEEERRAMRRVSFSCIDDRSGFADINEE